MTDKELRELRNKLGLTQEELSQRLGVARVTVARWELGLRQISEPMARLIQYLQKEVKAEQQKKKR